MSAELKTVEANKLQSVETNSNISPIVQAALSGQIETDKLNALLDIQAKYEAMEARKAYNVAVAEFKANSPTILKDRHVEYNNTKYDHATLGGIMETVNPELSKYGLSLSWRTKQEGPSIRVYTVLSHVAGHSEETTLDSPPDSSGGKNSIQAIGSTVSYLQRYGALSLLGLAAMDADDDAISAVVETITEEQAATISDLIDANERDREQFMNWIQENMGAETISDIPADNYARIIATLERKK